MEIPMNQMMFGNMEMYIILKINNYSNIDNHLFFNFSIVTDKAYFLPSFIYSNFWFSSIISLLISEQVFLIYSELLKS